MNAPFRPLTAAQVTSSAVLDRCLRTAHEIEGLLNSTIGTIDHEAKHAVITDAQRTEARTVAGYLAGHVATLLALAGDATLAAEACRDTLPSPTPGPRAGAME